MRTLSPPKHVKVNEKLVNRPRNDTRRDIVQKGRDEVQDNRLDHDAPIVSMFGDNAKRLECPLVAISGHAERVARASALPP